MLKSDNNEQLKTCEENLYMRINLILANVFC